MHSHSTASVDDVTHMCWLAAAAQNRPALLLPTAASFLAPLQPPAAVPAPAGSAIGGVRHPSHGANQLQRSAGSSTALTSLADAAAEQLQRRH